MSRFEDQRTDMDCKEKVKEAKVTIYLAKRQSNSALVMMDTIGYSSVSTPRKKETRISLHFKIKSVTLL